MNLLNLNVPYAPPSSGCRINDTLNTANNLCYISGTYSPICNSGDTYIPNNNICIVAGSTTSPYVSGNSTCLPGSVLIGNMCYPNGTYNGICNSGYTSSNAPSSSSRLYWCNSVQQQSDQDIYNASFSQFLNLQDQYANSTSNCDVSYNVILALTIPIILIFALIICYLTFK